MTTVSLRFDDETKHRLDEICDELGMNLTTFFMIYAKKVVRDGEIPFKLSTTPKSLFYSKANMKQLEKAEEQIRTGRVVTKTMDELEAMENE